MRLNEQQIAKAQAQCEKMEAAWQARLSLGENGDMDEALRANNRLTNARLEAWRYLPDALIDLAELHEENMRLRTALDEIRPFMAFLDHAFWPAFDEYPNTAGLVAALPAAGYGKEGK